MDLRKWISVGLLSTGLLFTQGCGGGQSARSDLLKDGSVGSNTDGINKIEISMDQTSQTCAIQVKGEYDKDNPGWAVVHTKLIFNRDKIKWVSTDNIPVTYNVEFIKDSPLPNAVGDITPSQPQTASVGAGLGVACILSQCNYQYDIKVNGNSCLPKKEKDSLAGIGIIVKP